MMWWMIGGAVVCALVPIAAWVLSDGGGVNHHYSDLMNGPRPGDCDYD